MIATQKNFTADIGERLRRFARRCQSGWFIWRCSDYTPNHSLDSWRVLTGGDSAEVNAIDPAGEKLRLLGYDFMLGGHDFWHLSPDSGNHWPQYYYSDYDLRAASCGDYKLIWELGRLQFLPPLLEKNPQRGRQLLESFLDSVEPMWSIHWYSEMEIAIRMISLIQSAQLLGNTQLRQKCLRAVNIHYEFLRQHITTHWTLRNNHILIECCSLIIHELLFDSDQRKAWLKQHFELLATELRDQIYPDGGLREQSTAYTRFNLEAFLLTLQACRAADYDAPEFLTDVTRAMLNWLAAMRLPDGRWPMIGDNDDGHVGCYKPMLDNRDYSYLFDWARRCGIEVSEHINDRATLLADSGYWIWRSGCGDGEKNASDDASRNRNGTQLIFRCGDFGLGGDGGAPHTHSDELSFVLAAAGCEVFTDCGTFTYDPRGEENLREKFRSAQSHNVVTVDGDEQAESRGNFSWGKNPRCQITDTAGDFVLGELESYDGKYLWCRRIEIAASQIEITDQLRFADDKTHQLQWYFNVAPAITAVKEAAVVKLLSGDKLLATLSCCDPTINIETSTGIFSESYNSKLTSTRLTATAAARSTLEVKWKIQLTS